MIELQLSHALALYSTALAVMVFAIWLYTELSVKRPQRHLGQQFLWRCTFCGCSYLDEQAEEISQCPRCESFNVAAEASQAGVAGKSEPGQAQEEDERSGGTSRRKRPNQRRRGPRRRGRR